MKMASELLAYETPQVEVEKGFAGSDGGETPDYDV